MATFTFITHPNVVIDPQTPVPEWPLSEVGRRRMRAGLAQPWVASITRIFCSAERKAIDGAQILAEHLGLSYTVEAALGENDRSSTGFLPADAFEAMADRFFAEPELSAEGWERAIDAQARIVRAVETIASQVGADDRVAIVSHGAVGTLLYCRLAGLPIARRWDQPTNGGGNYFAFDLDPPRAHAHWLPLDAA